MSADAAPAPLSKVDSAVQGLSSSPSKDEAKNRRSSSSVAGVYNIADLGKSSPDLIIVVEHQVPKLPVTINNANTNFGRDIEKEGKELQIAKETQKLNWYEYPLS